MIEGTVIYKGEHIIYWHKSVVFGIYFTSLSDFPRCFRCLRNLHSRQDNPKLVEKHDFNRFKKGVQKVGLESFDHTPRNPGDYRNLFSWKVHPLVDIRDSYRLKQPHEV